MKDITTDELEKVLETTHPHKAGEFLKQNEDAMYAEASAFPEYMRGKIKEKGMLQQTVFLAADIPERYGYKLLSGEKRTRQRDIILRLCYAADFTLDEVQKALRLYPFPELYAKFPRDALLMIAFNEHPGDIIDVNAFLKENNAEVLRSSGVQE